MCLPLALAALGVVPRATDTLVLFGKVHLHHARSWCRCTDAVRGPVTLRQLAKRGSRWQSHRASWLEGVRRRGSLQGLPLSPANADQSTTSSTCKHMG